MNRKGDNDMQCVDCDACRFRTMNCLCEISENDEDCPLANLSDFNSCVIGLTFEKTPILSYSKMVSYLAEENNVSINDSMEFIDYNLIRALDAYKTKPIIMYGI